jgi:hypothetical protein
LLGLFFDPKDGGSMFLQNVGWLSADYMSLHPRKQNSWYSHPFPCSLCKIYIFLFLLSPF